ncbi:MAG: hypothetical protein ACI308_00920 [Muribaculaceae bacterium]
MGKSELLGAVKDFMKSPVAKKVFSYLCFVAVSAVFWLVNMANKTSVHDVELPFEIVNVPDSVIFLSDSPHKINVSIRETGINAFFKKKVKISVKFSDYDMGSGVFRINLQQLSAKIREKYSHESMINSIMPDSITLRYVDPRRDFRRVPIVLDFTAKANMQYEIVGAITMSCDSVMVYADHDDLTDVSEVYTYHVDEKELTDTLYRKVSISPIKNVRIEPREITVMVPVEKLIKKVRSIPVVVKNRPDNVNVITFPNTVKVSYLVPKSQYNNSDKRISAIVDYNDILYSPKANKVELRIGEVPMVYKNVSLETDSVEYIIERSL